MKWWERSFDDLGLGLGHTPDTRATRGTPDFDGMWCATCARLLILPSGRLTPAGTVLCWGDASDATRYGTVLDRE